MDPRLVFVRTAKGEEEFERRTHGLSQALRRVLILVDGKSPVARIMERGLGLPDVEGALTTLAQEGFIATAEEAGRRGLGVGDPKAELATLARSLLGPQSAKVVKKIQESGDTPQELAATIDSCRKLIKLFIDDAKAEEFARRAHELLFSSTQMGH
ncbi:hypothetical protein [Thiobacter aerophilum]|uniref:Uncharacterized protein n=1 Tax=Thiobacter aerophilum TaxID=3121275 RepID=A0ABV0EF11_9BURK